MPSRSGPASDGTDSIFSFSRPSALRLEFTLSLSKGLSSPVLRRLSLSLRARRSRARQSQLHHSLFLVRYSIFTLRSLSSVFCRPSSVLCPPSSVLHPLLVSPLSSIVPRLGWQPQAQLGDGSARRTRAELLSAAFIYHSNYICPLEYGSVRQFTVDCKPDLPSVENLLNL